MRLGRTTWSLVAWTLTLALGGGLAACSDSSDDDSGSAAAAGAPGSDDDAADDDAADDDAADDDAADDDASDDDASDDGTVTVAISAEEGGTVTDEAGTVSLVIPAGALASDEELTLAVTEARDGAETSVYNFGPDGLTFDAPATLSIEFDGDVPEGMQAVLAVEDGGEWVAIDGSSASDGVVSGEITHFSSFTVIFVNGELIVASACGDRLEAFSACGGDVEGTWAFQEFCIPPLDMGASDPAAQCPGMYVDVDYQVSGTITFGTDTVTVGERQNTQSTVTNIPVSCLASSLATCDMLTDDDTTCAADGDMCQCSATPTTSTAPATEPQNYSVSGNELTVEESDGPKTYKYCVNGDELEILQESEPTDGTVTTVLEVLTRQ